MLDAGWQSACRARLKFAELLVAEVARAFDEPTPEQVQEELIALELWTFVRDAVPAAS